jgi:hypothetical protein
MFVYTGNLLRRLPEVEYTEESEPESVNVGNVGRAELYCSEKEYV